MKSFLFFVVMALSAVAMIADDWVLKDQFVPPVAKRPAGRVRLAGVDRLPERLPIGSPEVMRDYIVSTNVWLGQMLIETGVGYRSTSGKWAEITVIKGPPGYGSYNSALLDIKRGVEVALDKMATVTNYPPGGEIWGVLYITHFNDQSISGTGIDPVSLLIGSRTGQTLNTVTPDKVVQVFAADKSASRSQVIVPVPPLEVVEMEIIDGDTIGTMTWTRDGGVQLSSWTTPEKVVSVGYLYVSQKAGEGVYPFSTRLVTSSGQKEYVVPTIRMSPTSVTVSCKAGTTIVLKRTTDFTGWETVWEGQTISPTSSFPIPRNGMGFYRVVTR